MCYSLPPSPCWLQVSKIMRRETFWPTSSARTGIATLLGAKGDQLDGTCGWWLGEEPGLLWSSGVCTRAQHFCKTQHLSQDYPLLRACFLKSYLLVVLGLGCCSRAFSSCDEQGPLSSCSAQASLAAAVAHPFSGCGAVLRCSAARGILPAQGPNPCPVHWQAGSYPLRHQGVQRPFLGSHLLFLVEVWIKVSAAWVPLHVRWPASGLLAQPFLIFTASSGLGAPDAINLDSDWGNWEPFCLSHIVEISQADGFLC